MRYLYIDEPAQAQLVFNSHSSPDETDITINCILNSLIAM